MNLLSLTEINRLQKQNIFEPCDVIYHVIVAFYIYHFMCDTSLDALRRQLQHLCTQQSTKISKKLNKSQK
jgi:hypothetical protein